MAPMTGPRATAVWKAMTLPGGADYQVLADATDSQRWYYLPRRHRVVTTRGGSPELSLTLLLQQTPAPDAVDLRDLVRQGSVAMTVVLADVDGLPDGVEPLFIRSATCGLIRHDGTSVASGKASGWQTTFAATIERDDALAVLDAIHSQGDVLAVRSELTYRAVDTAPGARLTGSWADVYDLAVELLYPPTASDLRWLYGQALQRRLVHIEPPDRSDAFIPSFVSSGKAALFNGDGTIGRRPSPYFTIDIAVASSESAVEQTVVVETPLREVFGGCLDHVDASEVISLISMTPSNAAGTTSERATRGVGSPRRIRSAPGERDTAATQPRFAVGSAGRLSSTAAVLTLAEPARADLNTQIARTGKPAFVVGVHAAAFGDLSENAAADTADLPVLADPAGWVFAGRNGAPNWYVPTFEVVRPSSTDDATTSPFVFRYRRVGATAAGQPGLEASITFKLRPVIGAEVSAAGGAARSIPIDGAQVSLDIPFRDGNGANQRQRFTADTTWDGAALTATVPLLDDWARLAYGALSQAGFQVEPARLAVSWSFKGWQQLVLDDEMVAFGGKAAQLAVRQSAPTLVENPHIADPLRDPDLTYLDTSSATLVSPQGNFQFRAAAAVSAATRTRFVAASPLLAIQPALRQRPIEDPPVREGDQPIKGHFPGDSGPIVPQPLPRIRWLIRTFARSEVVEVLFPCTDVGSCYVEQRPEGLVPVGCQDALRLGQAPWRQYEEIPALAAPAYQVYRSLQQPGRFLVRPRQYVLSRYAPDSLRAYQPAILLYALLDAANPLSNQVVVQATLQPAIEACEWDTLGDRLRSYAPNPMVALLTDVEGTAAFSWTVVNLPSVSLNATLVPGGILVTIQSDLAHALLLRDMLTHDGIFGSLSMTLPDGTALTAALNLALTHVTGPTQGGPVEVTVTGSAATLTNRIERAVSVSSLRVTTSGNRIDIPVERTLKAADAVSVSLPNSVAATPPAAADCQPVYTVPDAAPADLTEIRSFVEDIAMNVIFLDLVDHPTHGISRLGVRSQLVDASGIQDVPMNGSPASGQTSYVLPLTTYLANRTVRYQVSVTHPDGTSVDGSWQTWDASAHGCLIGLTWESLGLPS